MKRKRYKAMYGEMDEEMLKRVLRPKTYAEILDAWREFYTKGLIDEEERRLLKNLLRKELCDCGEPSEEEELKRINQLANALKGTLDKAPK